MAQAELTQQSVLEAKIAASLAADFDLMPKPIAQLSDQAEIFASNNTNAFMFTGFADADSDATNFGTGLATKAIEQVIELEEKRRKDDDPAGDAGMIAELAARQREEIIRIGRITATRAELIAFSDAMKTPEFRARFRQELRDQGVPEDQIDGRMDRAEELADLAVKVNDGTATSSEQARFDELEADETVAADLETALDLNSGSDLSVNSTISQTSPNTPVNDQAPVPSSGDDADFLAMMGDDAPVTVSPDREGPIITADYNSNAVGEKAKSDTQPDATPAPAPAFSLDA